MKQLGRQWAADEEQAGREHEDIIQNKPTNPAHLERAFEALQQGINPETGEPLQTPGEASQAMERAAVWPKEAENHQSHLHTHGMFTKSREFEALPTEVQGRLLTHYQITQQMAESLPQPEPQAPKVNLQIKSTASPNTQEKILRQAGIPVTSEDTMMPPLETWVTDSVDKPDVDADGPGQSGMLTAIQKQEMHELQLVEQKLKNQKLLAEAQSLRRGDAKA